VMDAGAGFATFRDGLEQVTVRHGNLFLSSPSIRGYDTGQYYGKGLGAAVSR
jgi:hypothetical protein